MLSCRFKKQSLTRRLFSRTKTWPRGRALLHVVSTCLLFADILYWHAILFSSDKWDKYAKCILKTSICNNKQTNQSIFNHISISVSFKVSADGCTKMYIHSLTPSHTCINIPKYAYSLLYDTELI